LTTVKAVQGPSPEASWTAAGYGPTCSPPGEDSVGQLHTDVKLSILSLTLVMKTLQTLETELEKLIMLF
jgi:hypothetical protein